MQQAVQSRKRAAPNASPMVQPPEHMSMPTQQQQQPAYHYPQMPDNPDFANFDFSNPFVSEQQYPDPSLDDPNNYSTSASQLQPQQYASNIATAPSTDLVRRARNQQLATQNAQQEQWNDPSYGTMNGQEEESEKELEKRAAIAQREAQSKRKSIPPFVQKLASFLNNGENTHLIRWSDDGRSFIVLDEDEFARTLIPELFKHNNYASFVRQLNMYGFHKTVNITDGSLRQSEKARKGVKPPSMYSHPYFRRNRRDLLWLIQKPTTKTSAKRKRDNKDGYDSDEERQYSPGPDSKPAVELGAANGTQDLTSMPRGELTAVRQEIKKLQQQQNLISRMITQLKEQNDQFYRQATAFQALHDRHENSINAILTFLATFYNRSLEGHAGQNLVNMFSNNGNQENQQQHGSVVEEYNDATPETSNQVQRYVKRPQLLLTGPNAPSPQNLQTGNAVTQPNSARGSTSPPDRPAQLKRSNTGSAPPQSGVEGRAASTASPAIKDDAQTPDLLGSVPEDTEQVMSYINAVNATSGASNASQPAYDFSNMPNVTPQQRNDVLSFMATQGNSSAENALALSNSMDMSRFAQNNDELQTLQRMSSDTNNRIAELEQRLGPFTPTGSISGAVDGPGYPSSFVNDGNGFIDYSNDADMNFLNNYGNGDTDWSSFLNSNPADTGADMFQTGETDAADDHLAPPQAGAGTIESLSSEATSPAQLADDGDAADLDPGTPGNKRPRIS